MAEFAGRQLPNESGRGTGLTSADVADVRAKMRAVAAPYDAAHLLAVLTAERAFVGPDWRESESGSPLADENVIATLLERPSRQPTAPAHESSQDVLAVVKHLWELGMEAATITMYSTLDGKAGHVSAAAEIAAEFRARDAVVRGDAYEAQALDLVRRLFVEPTVAGALRGVLGFDAEDAIACEQGLTRIGERRYRVNELRHQDAILNPRLVLQLSVTPAALVRETRLSEPVITSFLEAFCTAFGHRERGGALLGGNSQIRQRPLIAVEPGHYLSTSGVNLLAALRPTLEEALKRTTSWEHYQAHRAAVIECFAQDLLSRALSPDQVWPNVAYDVQGVGTAYEADRLLLVDDTLFVVEAKAGTFSDRALRGRPATLVEELASLVGKGSTQASRVELALAQGRALTFRDRSTGHPLNLPTQQIRRIVPILVTLSPLGWLQGMHPLLARAGVFGGVSSKLPWIVNVHELDLIVQLTDHPGQLSRFIQLRRALPPEVSNGSDEVNLWMLYLLRNLERFPRASRIITANATEEVDGFMLFGGPRPVMELTTATRDALMQLETARCPGWLAGSEQIIAAEQKERRPFFGSVRSLAESSLRHRAVS